MIYNQYLFKTIPFEPEKLTPIVNLFHLIQVLVVNSNLNVKTVDQSRQAVEGKTRHAQLSHRLDSLRRLHGQSQEE